MVSIFQHHLPPYPYRKKGDGVAICSGGWRGPGGLVQPEVTVCCLDRGTQM